MTKTFVACSAAAVLAVAGAAGAQCVPAWDLTIGTPGVDNPPVITNPNIENNAPSPDFGGYAGDFLPFTANGQESLIVAGSFSTIGGVPNTGRIARFDGTNFHAMGLGIPQGMGTTFVNVLQVFNGELWVGGVFEAAGVQILDYLNEPNPEPTARNLARWDGTNWIPVNTQQTNIESFNAMLVWNGELYVGGRFNNIGGTPIRSVAKWNPATQTFTQVGNGFDTYFDATNPQGPNSTPSLVEDLIVYNDGSGEKLYAAGSLFFPNTTNTASVNRPVCRLNPTTNTWEPVAGVNQDTLLSVPLRQSVAGAGKSMVVWDYGRGPRLIVAARQQPFLLAQKSNTDFAHSASVFEWDGVNWSEFPSAPDSGRSDATVRPNVSIQELLVFNDGDGEALYAFGSFTNSTSIPPQPMNRIARIMKADLAAYDPVAAVGDPSIIPPNWATYAGGVSLPPIPPSDDPPSAGNPNPFTQVIGVGLWNSPVGNHLYIGGSFKLVDGQPSTRIARRTLCSGASACRADFDGQNGVQVADIFAFLSAWFNQLPSANFDSNPAIDVADIFAFLSAWFTGCP